MTKVYYSASLIALCLWGTSGFSAPAPQNNNNGANVGVREPNANNAPFRSFPPDGASMMTRYNNNMMHPQQPPRGRRPAPSRETLDPTAPPGGRMEPMSTVQGGSRQTWSSPYNDSRSTQINLQTQGRPLTADVELWQGPNNTPQRLKVYSEDGHYRPIKANFDNGGGQMMGQSLSVRNQGPMEFPMDARVAKTDLNGAPGGGSIMGQQQPRPALLPDGLGYRTSGYQNVAARNGGGVTVQGGALETFPTDPSTQSVDVTIFSEGMPVTATIEIWQGPGRIATVAEVYTDNGATKPFHAQVPTPGYGSTIVVINDGPMEYPLKVVLTPCAEAVQPEYDQPTNQGFYSGMISPGFRTIG